MRVFDVSEGGCIHVHSINVRFRILHHETGQRVKKTVAAQCAYRATFYERMATRVMHIDTVVPCYTLKSW